MEYLASVGGMTRTKLEEIMTNYSQQKFMEQMQAQQGGQPRYQADAYLNANLTGGQQGLAFEITRVFNLSQYAKSVDERYNPKPKDTVNNKPPDTSLIKLPDTSKGN